MQTNFPYDIVFACSDCRQEPERVEEMSAWVINQFVRQEFQVVSHRIDLPLTNGDTFEWQVARPDKLVEAFSEWSETFATVMAAAARQTRGEPLSAILYFDEITPSNVLAPQNSRKVWAWYLAFQEVGSVLLSKAHFWMPVAILRTSVVSRVQGGFSACLRALLRSILFGPCNLGTVGAPVALPSGPLLLRAHMAHMLADEAALKAAWSAKGAAGLKPCMLCRNVMCLNGNLTGGQSYLVTVACDDARKLVLAEDIDVWEAWDHLASERSRLAKIHYDNLEKAVGFVYNEHGLLSDHALRPFVSPTRSTCMDWMHNFLQGGVAAQELMAFLGACKRKLRVGWKEVQLFVLSNWRFPVSQATHSVTSVFAPARERGGGTTLSEPARLRCCSYTHCCATLP